MARCETLRRSRVLAPRSPRGKELLGWVMAACLFLGAPSPATPAPSSKVLPWEHVGYLTMRRPSQFHRVEDTRERMLWQSDAKDGGWCQLALGQKEVGQKASFDKADTKKLAQTLFPYIQKAKGTKWKQVNWMGLTAYRMEFSGASANVRLYSAQIFVVRGGLLFWTGVVCPESQRQRWVPVFENWSMSARLDEG